MLGVGQFDNGKITEIKPIDFPGGGGKGKRIGPLFYWAWASAKVDGIISMHPHQAFEIISYVIHGEIGHTDTLNNKTRVGEGGAQVMQAGSGIYHQEEMYGDLTDFFQIWFEPNLKETITKPATYNQYQHNDFPIDYFEDCSVKHIIGSNSSVILDAEVTMKDVTISNNGAYILNLFPGKAYANLVVSGSGKTFSNEQEHRIKSRNYFVVTSEIDSDLVIRASDEEDLRLMIIEVPEKVSYSLYGED